MIVRLRNWWFRGLHGRVWDEARDAAFDNAAMVAYDAGCMDVYRAINRLRGK